MTGVSWEPVLPGLIVVLPLLGFVINGFLALRAARWSSAAVRSGEEWNPFAGKSLPATHSLPTIVGPGVMLLAFGLALLIVFLVLAAQFESFVHPLVILVTVPLAVAGALLGLYLTGLSINIFSQIGIVMLIGIAAKNGVLIVEFINQIRDAGRSFEDAIIEASGIRLRPVVMTTISTIMGSIPLILATGAGAESRMVLGIVVFSGVSLATFLTLFIVPSFYALLARRTGSPQSVSRRLASHLESVR